MSVLVLGSLELGSRLYWWSQHGVPLHRPAEVLYVFYPNLKTLTEEANRPTADRWDVLVLGGSVIDEMRPEFDTLGEQMGAGARFHVGARVAHTTLDSWRKYGWLDSVPYDAVLVYHGINDCKYNSVPEARFDAEYSAYPFYRATSALLQHTEISWLALPFTLRFAWIQLTDIGDQKWRRPVVRAKAEWRRYGHSVKTATTFRGNLEQLIEQAGERQQTVYLATFASYIPRDYTLERFEGGELDYDQPRLPVEVWGEADAVRRCIDVHNRMVIELASHHENVQLIDLKTAVPASGSLFDDPCHLSAAGRERFFATLRSSLGSTLADSRAAQRGSLTENTDSGWASGVDNTRFDSDGRHD